MTLIFKMCLQFFVDVRIISVASNVNKIMFYYFILCTRQIETINILYV